MKKCNLMSEAKRERHSGRRVWESGFHCVVREHSAAVSWKDTVPPACGTRSTPFDIYCATCCYLSNLSLLSYLRLIAKIIFQPSCKWFCLILRIKLFVVSIEEQLCFSLNSSMQIFIRFEFLVIEYSREHLLTNLIEFQALKWIT